MSDEQALRDVHDILAGAAAVTALAGARIYQGEVPEGEDMPAIVYRLISPNDENVLAGGAPIAARRIEVSSWADDAGTARALADAAYSAMIAAGHYRIAAVTLTDDATHRHHHSQDFSVWSDR